MWSKERIKDQISKITPNDVTIQNLSFFSGQKIIISGYGHISRQGQLKSNEKQLSSRSSWIIKYDIIPISGPFDKKILPTIFSFIPRLEINSITIDQNLRFVLITFQKQPSKLLNKLQELETNLKIPLKLNSLESSNFITISELKDIISKNYVIEGVRNQKIDNEDLKAKIKALLPSWIKTTKITIYKDKAIIETSNDISDLERISFLNLLLESQIGLKIEIKQSYNIDNQIITLKKLLKNYFKKFKVENISKEGKVSIQYDDFPLSDELLAKIKSEMYKKVRLEIIEFISNFEKNSVQICLQLKEWITNKYPIIEYCFVHFNANENRFDILLPEETSSDETSIEYFQNSIKNSYNFTYPFQVKWIEEDPVFYLRQRIFIGEQQSQVLNIEYKRPNITIFHKNTKNITFAIWEKILFRFFRFEINFLDRVTNSTINLFELNNYLKQLSKTKLSELLFKLVSHDLNDSDIHSVVFEEENSQFIINYDNFFNKNKLQEFCETWTNNLGTKVVLRPIRTQDEIIFQFVSSLPEWLINPKVYFDNKENLILIVQNDYEDKLKLEKYVAEQSEQCRIPIVLEINLTISRIKQIIYQSLEDFIEIIRLKIYPEKTNVYLEGILKTDQDEDLLETEINRIEEKTKFTVESYIKRKSAGQAKQSVHDLLQTLLNSYQILPFSDEQYQAGEAIEDFNVEKHGLNRIDLRDLDCFSIDPTGTKAVDDCISIQRITHPDKEDELLIGVHVADIASFISKDSILDEEARRRSFSVYLNYQKQTYPLFPENVLEKVSLKAGQDKPALSLFIRITQESVIEEFFIKKTIITNKKQFTYAEVNEILIEQNGDYLTDLQLLVSITSQFKSDRIIRGSINLDFMPDNIADQIVSELMIMANRLVAFHLQSLPGQKIFRNQHIQSYTYLLLQKNFGALGYNFDLLNKNPLTDLNRILQEAAINGESELIMSELRNYLSNAYYSHSCTGHEALGTKWYTQWTSPLRKYMDVTVHRLLNKEYVEDLQYLCQYSSAVERLLKIKVDSGEKSYLLDLLGSFVTEEKKLGVQIFKKTARNVILSTDQDFFLFILYQNDFTNNSLKKEIENRFANLNDNENAIIRLIKVLRDKKDINVVFKFINKENVEKSSIEIKAKILFLDE